HVDYSELTDLLLEGSDFIKIEVHKLRNGEEADGVAVDIIHRVEGFLNSIKGNHLSMHTNRGDKHVQGQTNEHIDDLLLDLNESAFTSPAYHAIVTFDEDCSMENVRAFSIIHQLKELVDACWYTPVDIDKNE